MRVYRVQIKTSEAQFTSQETHCASNTRTKHSVTFKKIIAVYSENRMKFVNELHGHNADVLMLKHLVHVVVTELARDEHTRRQYVLY
jgi:hypothetical protein